MNIERFHIINVPKDDILYKYSNPIQAQRNAFDYGNLQLYKSVNPDKKYMIINPDTGKLVHFGQQGAYDYTKHKDEKRRHKFLVRNHKWTDYPKYSPASLSYYILW